MHSVPMVPVRHGAQESTGRDRSLVYSCTLEKSKGFFLPNVLVKFLTVSNNIVYFLPTKIRLTTYKLLCA